MITHLISVKSDTFSSIQIQELGDQDLFIDSISGAASPPFPNNSPAIAVNR